MSNLKSAFTKRATSPSKSPTSKKLKLNESTLLEKEGENPVLAARKPHKENKSKWLLKAQENVGIKCFISSLHVLPGFNGIIKHRFNDFHVHEIDENGSRVILTDCRVNAFKNEKENQSDPISLPEESLLESKKIAHGEKCEETIEPIEETEEYDSIKAICSDIQSLLDEVTDFPTTLFAFITSFDPLSNDHASMTSPIIKLKEKRTEFHNMIRKINSHLHTKSIESKTINSNAINLIMTKKSKRKQKHDQRNSKSNAASSQRISWAEKGEYCHFTLYKENKDTMEAISLISKLLRVESKLFTFCGTKDKRGITSQRVSAYRISQERLAGLNKNLRGIRLGNFSYEKERLQLGDSTGNHFSIVIREVQSTADPSTLLKSCLSSLSTLGFINYFGMQRFGSRQISTHVIGSFLLSERWEEACMQILGKDEPPPNNRNVLLPATSSGKANSLDFHAAKEYLFETMDFEGSLPMFPRYCTAERSILNSFISQRRQGYKNLNYLQAIQSITRNLRLMYVHAYQSRVWNEMVSLRHEKFGMKLVMGDLVRIKAKDGENNINLEEATVAEDSEFMNEDTEGGRRRGLYDIKVIENDQDVKDFTIYDLVLPLPGHQVKYPSNMEDDYISFMDNDGFDPRQMSRKVREISLPGFYRHVYALPANVNGYIAKYSDERKNPVDFLISDVQKLEGTVMTSNKEGDGDLTAFIMEFSLASSQYATMALREVMKTETSSSFHSALSQSSKDHIKIIE